MVTKTKYVLHWAFDGEVRGRGFDDWGELEKFSKRLIAAGLTPWVPPSSPTPYDGRPG
jgi:hypothetical protein